MDVDRLLKVNALASELRKHNFAGSNDDAVKQAQVAFGVEHVQHVALPASLMESSSDTLVSRQVELLFEQQSKKYDQAIVLLRSTMNQLMSELESVKGELKKMNEVAPRP